MEKYNVLEFLKTKKKKMHSSFQFSNRQIKPFHVRQGGEIEGELVHDSFGDNVERKNGDARFSRIEKSPLLSISEAVKSNGCNLMDYRTPRY